MGRRRCAFGDETGSRGVGEAVLSSTAPYAVVARGALSSMITASVCLSSSVANSSRARSSSNGNARSPVCGPCRISAGFAPRNAGVVATILLSIEEKFQET